MAYSSSSSNVNSKVHTCSSECEKSYAQLKKLYDEQREQLSDASVEIKAYDQGLKKVEAQLVVHQQNQLWYEQKIKFMKIDLDDKTDVLTYHKKLLAEALKEKEDLKTKFENWQSSSKNLGPSFPPSLAWLASLLWASSFCVKSVSAVWSVGMPISAGIIASVPYVSENDVSPLLDLIMVRCAYRTCKSSPIQSLLLSSNRALIPSPRLLFALSTKPFDYGCFTEVKHWRIHSFSHQSLNGLSRNCLPLLDTISPGRPNLQTMLSHMNFFT
ncbi:hypothetical protein Tco_1218752 [Tanacetum coccineum]